MRIRTYKRNGGILLRAIFLYISLVLALSGLDIRIHFVDASSNQNDKNRKSPPPPPPRPDSRFPRQFGDPNDRSFDEFPGPWGAERGFLEGADLPPPPQHGDDDIGDAASFSGPPRDFRDRELSGYRDDYPSPDDSNRWSTNAVADPYGRSSSLQPPPPPPPPPPPSNEMNYRPPTETASQYAPIHYNFPKEKKPEKKGKFGIFGRKKEKLPIPETSSEKYDRGRQPSPHEDDEDIPETWLPSPPRQQRYSQDRDDAPTYQSPRRDVITQFRSTFNGKVILTMSSGVAGSILGALLGKSILNRPGPMASIFFTLFVIFNFFRNPYGEFVRALGMALILALQRTRFIRRNYPTWRHIKASVHAVDRQPFPPATNPWAYRPERRNDPEFRMLYTVIAMAFVGSTCGGNLPLIPTWMGSLAGAGFFALSTTTNSPRGDLMRTMGMRVVALCYEFLGINSELEILRKGGVVSGKILDKLFILDRKHRIKDRLISAFSFAYKQISNQINRVQEDARGEAELDSRRGPAPGGQRGDDYHRPPPRERERDGPRRPPPGPDRRRPPPRDEDDRWNGPMREFRR